MIHGTRPRRIVTSHDAAGKAIVHIDDSPVFHSAEPELGVSSCLLWSTDRAPADISGKADAGARVLGIPPPANGTAFRFVEFLPETEAAGKLPAGHLAKLLGEGHMAGGKPPRHAAMHRTKTVDYIIILTGEIDMLLDDSEVHLKAGDVVVQQGTNHAWINRGKELCRVAAILVDAKSL